MAAALADLPVYGTARRDACEAGQNNVWVQEDYRMRCGAAHRAVAALAANDEATAIEEAARQLARVRDGSVPSTSDPWFARPDGLRVRSSPLCCPASA